MLSEMHRWLTVTTIWTVWLVLASLFSRGQCFESSTADSLHAQTPFDNDLSSISTEAFSVLTNPRFPSHQVRIKSTKFCDPTVKVWTGYIDIGAKHLFFYFFESRANPDTDDVIMWINGGPGCSSSMGLLMELGPCNIDMTKSSSNGTLWNPYSWNSNANVFFLDQPVGVGFSYADFGETVETTQDAAQNVYAFISIFFDTFKRFQGRRFHLAGESYAGKYLPVFAAQVYDNNRRFKASGGIPVNLSSVIIGNGITDISTLYAGRYEVACGTTALETPLQDIATCVRMKQALPRCQRMMHESCVHLFDGISCLAAVNFCDAELSAPFQATGRNVYDVSKMCLGDNLCYLEVPKIAAFLDKPSIRDTLGVPPSISNFSACSSVVGQNFYAHLDKWAVPSQYYVANLLERGVRVLLYAGSLDWQCNGPSIREWSYSLEWSGGNEFRSKPLRDWRIPEDDKAAGQVRSAKNFTFISIYRAGHMVPHDRPVEALYMLKRWLSEEEL